MSRQKLRIKGEDIVKVITGKDKGKIGRVLRVLPEDGRVIVEGVARVRRHQKPVGEQAGSIVEKEASIHVSNVALWNASEGRRVKVALRVQDDKKIRVDRKTGQAIDKV